MKMPFVWLSDVNSYGVDAIRTGSHGFAWMSSIDSAIPVPTAQSGPGAPAAATVCDEGDSGGAQNAAMGRHTLILMNSTGT